MSKNCRSTEIPEEYGEGSKVLKACRPPSLVEYEQAKEGGDSKVAFLDNLEFQCVAQNAHRVLTRLLGSSHISTSSRSLL